MSPMSRLVSRILPVLVVLVAFSSATASAQGRPDERGAQWSLGLGVVGSPRPYVGADAEITPVPLFGVRAGRFFFETVRIGVRAVDTRHFDMDVLAQARFDGHEEDDSKFLAGMAERRMSADAGLRLKGSWDHFETTFTAMTDALSRHDGQELGLVFGFPMKAGGWTITPGLGAEWQSDDLADYYYGVEPDEALPSRPAYEVGSTVNPRVELSLRKPFGGRKWTFFSTLTQEWLGSEIRDSPIVDGSSTFGGFIGILRTW